MNSPKQNHFSLFRVLLVALVALSVGVGISYFVVPAQTPLGPKNPMAGFLVKADRPLVPDLAFLNGKGEPVSLAQWRGRVVLLNLWATWCAPCRKEMPMLAALQAQKGSAAFEVVALSVDRKGIDVSGPFLQETGANALALYADPKSKAIEQLLAPGLPLTLLIDKQGREIGRLIGPADWNSAEAVALVEKALAEK